MVAIFPFGVSCDWGGFKAYLAAAHVIDGVLIFLSQQTYYNIQFKKLRQLQKKKDGDKKQ